MNDDKVINGFRRLDKKKSNSMGGSCGFVIFRRRQGRVEYLVLQIPRDSLLDHWELVPEANTNPGESDVKAALRITEEKTGLVEADLKVYEKPKQEISCRCLHRHIYIRMLAELTNTEKPLKLSSEYQDAKWLEMDDVLKIAEDLEFTLRDFNVYIKNNIV